ncbi:MAG TPA: hypothetical protein VGD78_14360 [Chthoniobacterales bacterium]
MSTMTLSEYLTQNPGVRLDDGGNTWDARFLLRALNDQEAEELEFPVVITKGGV